MKLTLPRACLAGGLAAVAVGLVACRSTSVLIAVSRPELERAVIELRGPTTGDLAALYRLRARRSGSLRLSVQTRGSSGRLSLAEPFGSTLAMGAWDGFSPLEWLDLRQGCRVRLQDLSSLLGGTSLPMPQAILLLGGRLPAVDTDTLTLLPGGRVRVEGQSWSAIVQVQPQPWRVVAVTGPAHGRESWAISMTGHQGSVPVALRFDSDGGQWAELELIRQQWRTPEALPGVPDLPWCE